MGCVSFLNTLPLIDGLEADPEVALRPMVPSALLEALVAGRCEAALLPVIDYHRAPRPLEILPAGGIACEGRSWTVRLYARRPPGELERILVDADSHTSVALLRVLVAEREGTYPELLPFEAPAGGDESLEADGVLLIGDKVITGPVPDERAFPYRIDLGEAWRRMTGLPFVFATWMVRAGTGTDALGRKLEAARVRDPRAIERIADVAGPARGWEAKLAREYLGRRLRYAIGPREIEAMERFAALAARHGAIEAARPLAFTEPPSSVPVP